MADLGFFKGRGHSGATIYRGGPSIMQFFFIIQLLLALADFCNNTLEMELESDAGLLMINRNESRPVSRQHKS